MHLQIYRLKTIDNTSFVKWTYRRFLTFKKKNQKLIPIVLSQVTCFFHLAHKIVRLFASFCPVWHLSAS